MQFYVTLPAVKTYEQPIELDLFTQPVWSSFLQLDTTAGGEDQHFSLMATTATIHSSPPLSEGEKNFNDEMVTRA